MFSLFQRRVNWTISAPITAYPDQSDWVDRIVQDPRAGAARGRGGEDCLRRVQPDHQPLAQQRHRLRDARQLRCVMRVEQAAHFFFVHAEPAG